MLTTIITAIICFFAIIGLLEIYWEVEYRIFYKKAKRKIITIIPLTSKSETEIEHNIKATNAFIKNIKGLDDSQIIFLDLGADYMSVALCQMFCKNDTSLTYLKPDNLKDYIEKHID
ncbi:MAG: hypothetical protein IJC83_04635 [Oscillospiraceae bacterium]|nr:hypothetical protein [Oscillospiraceae bacterium]